jgi:hypothetical protein
MPLCGEERQRTRRDAKMTIRRLLVLEKVKVRLSAKIECTVIDKYLAVVNQDFPMR